MDIIICPRWISRYLEGERYGGTIDRRNRIRVSRRIFKFWVWSSGLSHWCEGQIGSLCYKLKTLELVKRMNLVLG